MEFRAYTAVYTFWANLGLLSISASGYTDTSWSPIMACPIKKSLLIFQAIVVFYNRLKIQRNFHALMLCLAAFDLVYIIVSILIFAMPQFSDGYLSSGAYYFIMPWWVWLINQAWSYLDKEGWQACQITSPFNKKIGCFRKTIFLILFLKNNQLIVERESYLASQSPLFI